MAYRSSSTNSGNSATPSVAVPASVEAGDIVILVCAFDHADADFATGDWPSGFTELQEVNITADGHSAAIGWKRLTEADSGSYTFGDLGAGSLDWVCQAAAFSGRHASDPPVVSSASVQNTGQTSPITVTANGVTAVDGDDLLWASAPDVTSSGIGDGHTPPADFTERQDAENVWANLSIATRDNVSAGATGSISGTFALTANNAGWAAFLVRIPVAGTPPQKARPDSDVSTGSWTTTSLFDKVDETTASDADFITSASAPSNDTCELGLSDVTDPTSSSDHILRVRRKKSAASGNQMDMRYRLLQGATEIASWTDDTNISDSDWATVDRTLSGGQADSITDYANLRVEIRANQNAQTPSAPTFVGRSATLANTATSGADVTPAMPSGHQAGDINIIVAHHSGSLGWATPSGWNLISGISGQNGALAQNVAVFWRREVGGDTAPAVSLASPDNVTTVRGACMYGFRGCISTGDPWDSGSGAGPTRLDDAADDAVVDTTSITTTVANCLVFFVGAYEDDPSGGSQPTGYTAVTARTTATGTDCGIYDCNKSLSGTGTENPSTTLSGGTFANSPHCGILIALKPEPFPDVAGQVSWVEFEAPGIAGGVSTDVATTAATSRTEQSDVTTTAAISRSEQIEVTTSAAVSQTGTNDVETSAALSRTEQSNVTTDAATTRVEQKDITTDGAFSRSEETEVATSGALSQTGQAEVGTDASVTVAGAASADVTTSAATSRIEQADITTGAALSQSVEGDVATDAAASRTEQAEVETTGSLSRSHSSEVGSDASISVQGQVLLEVETSASIGPPASLLIDDRTLNASWIDSRTIQADWVDSQTLQSSWTDSRTLEAAWIHSRTLEADWIDDRII